MANRHNNEKLRAKTRARTVETGESYQTAQQRILARTVEKQLAVAAGGN
jgi:hypothetical protein